MQVINKMIEGSTESVLSHKGEDCSCNPSVRLVKTKSKSGYALYHSDKIVTHNNKK